MNAPNGRCAHHYSVANWVVHPVGGHDGGHLSRSVCCHQASSHHVRFPEPSTEEAESTLSSSRVYSTCHIDQTLG
jgi:hypothetical protein